MTLKSKIGLTISTLIALTVSFITIRLSGHVHSLGILFIGVLIIDFFALLIGAIFYATRLLQIKPFVIYVGFTIATFFLFVLYHRSYDSYRETKSLFWGLNGEKDNINAR